MLPVVTLRGPDLIRRGACDEPPTLDERSFRMFQAYRPPHRTILRYDQRMRVAEPGGELRIHEEVLQLGANGTGKPIARPSRAHDEPARGRGDDEARAVSCVVEMRPGRSARSLVLGVFIERMDLVTTGSRLIGTVHAAEADRPAPPLDALAIAERHGFVVRALAARVGGRDRRGQCG